MVSDQDKYAAHIQDKERTVKALSCQLDEEKEVKMSLRRDLSEASVLFGCIVFQWWWFEVHAMMLRSLCETNQFFCCVAVFVVSFNANIRHF